MGRCRTWWAGPPRRSRRCGGASSPWRAEEGLRAEHAEDAVRGKQCGKCGEYVKYGQNWDGRVSDPQHIVAVAGLFYDEQGRVLLVKTERRGWECPGGQVECGEDLVEASVRE